MFLQIQATVPEPVNRNMYKGVSFCYSIISSTCVSCFSSRTWLTCLYSNFHCQWRDRIASRASRAILKFVIQCC